MSSMQVHFDQGSLCLPWLRAEFPGTAADGPILNGLRCRPSAWPAGPVLRVDMALLLRYNGLVSASRKL